MTAKSVAALGLRFLAVILIAGAIFEFAIIRISLWRLNQLGVHRRFHEGESVSAQIVSPAGVVPSSTNVNAALAIRGAGGVLLLCFASPLGNFVARGLERENEP